MQGRFRLSHKRQVSHFQLISTQEILGPFASILTISSTFNSLFKVLFIFRSHYLFAIGLPPVFSLRRSIPPILRCNPKQRDSLKIGRRVSPNLHKWTGLSPSLAPCSNGLIHGDNTEPTSQNYNSGLNLINPDSKFGLFPVHSPLLRESLLLSFPPLINMLKLSGYLCLI